MCYLTTLITVTTGDSFIHDQIVGRLRQSGQVYTSGRRQLVDLLLQHGRPASVRDLLKKRTRLAQSSMYRNLVDLERMGIVHKVASGDDHARYELDEALIGHHHHLICERCGTISDFEVTPAAERAIEVALRSASKSARFRLTGHRLDAIGLCVECK